MNEEIKVEENEPDLEEVKTAEEFDDVAMLDEAAINSSLDV